MKERLVDLLICPCCLPAEEPLCLEVTERNRDDIISGQICCAACTRRFPISDGIALLIPTPHDHPGIANKYETPAVISSYLWSHYADLMQDELALTAYREWAGLLTPHHGLALDAGCAVGRLGFEMTDKADFVVGLDTSRRFIATARHLMTRRQLTFSLKEEGYLSRQVALTLPDAWDSSKVEFIVADALAIPFKTGAAGSVASLNLLDKVPQPLVHLQEMNRVARTVDAQLLVSDPYSWSEEAAPEAAWLGGQQHGPFCGRGELAVQQLLTGQAGCLAPGWQIARQGAVWWRIRTHANHFEQIRSCYSRAVR